MQKAKFKIKGMHCQSCAVLIEEKLKTQPGIINAKVNYDSGKAVIIYDKQKIHEDKIVKVMEEAGDYRVEKIENQPSREESRQEDEEKESRGREESAALSNVLFSLKILIGLTIFSVILNVYSLNSFSKQLSQEGNQNNKNEAVVAENNPTQPTPPIQQLPSNQAPAIQTFEITKENHIRGNFDSPITLVEFSDFECPFCERHYPTLNKILNDYKGKVRLAYKHFPLSFHPNGQKAAEASECADEQGKFWEYHDKLFENLSGGYSLDNFKKWAKDLGLNSGKFNECLDSGKYAKKVQADFQEGTEKGVNGTPATFVNGQLVSGALPYDSFKQIIDSLLR
ncbi:MAG: thioredoxin domain-containing protein [Patescibacteria group bacterium]